MEDETKKLKGRGWRGNSKDHAAAGQKGGRAGGQGRGWHNDSERHARIGRIGGITPKAQKAR